MLSNEFKINKVDICIYVKNIDKAYAIIYVYVDDMLVLGNNNYTIKFITKMLTNKFDLKDLSITDVILGIKKFQDI